MTPPRMGDHYANQPFAWWTSNGDLTSRIVQLARRTFIPNRVTWIEFRTDEIVKASDAFAFGALKYGAVGGWRDVPLDHHLQAAGRHFHAWLQDPTSTDAESGLTHECHFLARAVMIQWLRRNK